MRRSIRLSVGAAAVATVLVLPAAGAAAPASTNFAVKGLEYAFTPTVGYFAGSAAGNAGDRGAWNTYVQHDPLGSTPTYITGGSFWMATRSPTGTYDWVSGTYVHHGGTITTIDPGANCTNQRYLVTGTLENVATRTTTGGTGTFAVMLTHYRALLFGRCITYSASVVGTATFDY
jgi:hypothetical protein